MQRVRADVELMRIIACIFVMVDHTCRLCLPEEMSKTWLAVALCFIVSKTAVPLFLMIMGAMLLGKRDSERKWLRRLGRGAGALVLGSLGYAAVYGWMEGGAFAPLSVLSQLPQRTATNAYWYLYLYLGILCLLPVLQRVVQILDKRWLGWLIVLHAGVGGAAAQIPVLFPEIGVYGSVVSGMFTSYLSLFSPYFGMVLLGYWVERYVRITKRTAVLVGMGLAVLTAFQLLVQYQFHFEGKWMNHPTYLTVILSSLCLYLLIKYIFTEKTIPTRFREGLLNVGGLTFGVYLLSDMAIRLTQERIFSRLSGRIHPFLAWGLWIMCMFLLCAGVTALGKGAWNLARRAVGRRA